MAPEQPNPAPIQAAGAAAFVNAARNRVDPAEVEQRLAERDKREASDTRSEAEKFLGHPPASRSALAAKR